MGLLLPIFYGTEWIWAIAMPLSLVYSGAIYVVVTYLVAPRILSQAPEILAVIARE
jgi:hypothetical protein